MAFSAVGSGVVQPSPDCEAQYVTSLLRSRKHTLLSTTSLTPPHPLIPVLPLARSVQLVEQHVGLPAQHVVQCGARVLGVVEAVPAHEQVRVALDRGGE